MYKFSSLQNIFSRLSLMIVLVAAGFLLSIGNCNASEKPSVSKTEQEINQPDSTLQATPMNIRLLDPRFDVRIERGKKKQPWHDLKSPYLRRTIPVNHLT